MAGCLESAGGTAAEEAEAAAVRWRQEGNRHYGTGNFAAALACYRAGASLKPKWDVRATDPSLRNCVVPTNLSGSSLGQLSGSWFWPTWHHWIIGYQAGLSGGRLAGFIPPANHQPFSNQDI